MGLHHQSRDITGAGGCAASGAGGTRNHRQEARASSAARPRRFCFVARDIVLPPRDEGDGTAPPFGSGTGVFPVLAELPGAEVFKADFLGFEAMRERAIHL